MNNVLNFIRWGLTHVDPSSIPAGAILPLPLDECGVEPAHYLLGTVWHYTTQAVIWSVYNKNYANRFTKDEFSRITQSWKSTDHATDCQGLCDAYFSVVEGIPTDINANANYTSWCTAKGKISSISREYVIGEAVFKDKNGTKTHIGYICGFMPDGEPLVLEAQGIYYGVRINKLCDRPEFTYRGLMTKKFEYAPEADANPEPATDPVKFEVTSPVHKGDAYKAMQTALMFAGYTDYNGDKLEPDGKWGRKSQAAFDKLIKEYAPASSEPVAPLVQLSIGDEIVYKSREE